MATTLAERASRPDRHLAEEIGLAEDRENHLAAVVIHPHNLHLAGNDHEQRGSGFLLQEDDAAFLVLLPDAYRAMVSKSIGSRSDKMGTFRRNSISSFG